MNEIILCHRAQAWECHRVGRPELAQLHMSFAHELEELQQQHTERTTKC